MLLSNAPSLMTINGGEALRRAATKLQNISAVAYSHTGNNIMHDKLLKFWKDQKERTSKAVGLPSDGVFVAPNVLDIRPDCYKVLTSIRLRGNRPDDLAAWGVFCDYFIMAADSLRSTRSAVASLLITPVYPDGLTYFPDFSAIFSVKMLDESGKPVPMSHDNPALGNLVVKYANEGTPANINTWREDTARTPNTNAYVFNHGRFTSPPSTVVPNGECTVHFKYVADVVPVVEGMAKYIRKVV